MTLSGYFALNSVFPPVWLSQTARGDRLSKNNCVGINKDRHTLSTAQIFGGDSSFWQYKVCADMNTFIQYSLGFSRKKTLKDGEVARCLNIFSWFENNCVKPNTDRPILQQLSCSAWTLVSGNIKFFAGIRRSSLARSHQTTVGLHIVSQRATVAYILHIRCVRNKS